MKKLYIITDVHECDARYDLKDNMIGTVIRVEPETIEYDPITDYVGAFESYQDTALWYTNADPARNYDSDHTYHLAIKIKPLQESIPVMLDYDTWYAQNEEELSIAAAESGADREYDYNAEDYCFDAYEVYCGALCPGVLCKECSYKTICINALI